MYNFRNLSKNDVLRSELRLKQIDIDIIYSMNAWYSITLIMDFIFKIKNDFFLINDIISGFACHVIMENLARPNEMGIVTPISWNSHFISLKSDNENDFSILELADSLETTVEPFIKIFNYLNDANRDIKLGIFNGFSTLSLSAYLQLKKREHEFFIVLFGERLKYFE